MAFVNTLALFNFEAGVIPSKSAKETSSAPAAILKAGTASLKIKIFELILVLYFFSIILCEFLSLGFFGFVTLEVEPLLVCFAGGFSTAWFWTDSGEV